MNATEEKKASVAWMKITGFEDVKLNRVGVIPLYDDGWVYVRNIGNTFTRPEQADALRRNVVTLMDHFPETVPQLEKLGIWVKALLKKPITTPEQVEAWDQSIFNTGPTTAQLIPKPTKSDTQRSVAPRSNGATSEPLRPRGRPRKDGLVPGSPEAKEADRVKRSILESERAAKRALKNGKEEPAEVIPVPRRRLVRIGDVAAQGS